MTSSPGAYRAFGQPYRTDERNSHTCPFSHLLPYFLLLLPLHTIQRKLRHDCILANEISAWLQLVPVQSGKYHVVAIVIKPSAARLSLRGSTADLTVLENCRSSCKTILLASPLRVSKHEEDDTHHGTIAPYVGRQTQEVVAWKGSKNASE